VTPLLTPEQGAAVRAAVERAEAASGAEIVPVVVAASDGYEVALWKGAALGSLGGAVAAAAAAWWRTPWVPQAYGALVPVALGLLAGMLLARLPAARRLLAGRAALDDGVSRGAAEAFLEHEVFRTRDRTGLLIYVSLFEREVRILADSGVHPSVPLDEWGALARAVAAEMARNPPGEALLAAVTRAGGLLAARGPERRADDVNELPDEPVDHRS
jgi:putative membrane protein